MSYLTVPLSPNNLLYFKIYYGFASYEVATSFQNLLEIVGLNPMKEARFYERSKCFPSGVKGLALKGRKFC